VENEKLDSSTAIHLGYVRLGFSERNHASWSQTGKPFHNEWWAR